MVDGWYAAAVVAVLWTTTTVSRRSKRIRRPKILGRFLFGKAVVSTNVDSISGFMDERVVHTLGLLFWVLYFHFGAGHARTAPRRCSITRIRTLFRR